MTRTEHTAIEHLVANLEEVARGLADIQRQTDLWLRSGAEIVATARRLLDNAEIDE